MQGNSIWCDNPNCTKGDGKRKVLQLGTRQVPNPDWVRQYGQANDGSDAKDYCCTACYLEATGYQPAQ